MLMIFPLLWTVSCAEVIVKESKVDPFLLILEKQKNIQDRLDLTLQKFESLDTKINDIEKSLKRNENHHKNLQENFNRLSERIKDIDLKLFKVENARAEFETEWKFGVDLLETEIRDLQEMCNASKATEERKLFWETVSKEDESKNSAILWLLFEKESNKTQEQLYRMFSLLHNVEYRQHVSSIAQDRRLNLLLERLANHERRMMTRIQMSSLHTKIEENNQENDSVLDKDKPIEPDTSALNKVGIFCVKGTTCRSSTTTETTSSEAVETMTESLPLSSSTIAFETTDAPENLNSIETTKETTPTSTISSIYEVIKLIHYKIVIYLYTFMFFRNKHSQKTRRQEQETLCGF